MPVLALVGYTNAGKSTLFNRLTGADVFADNLLFATLDPTMRSVALPSGRTAILSDTVGFVSNLPTDLVAAFRATLEEVKEADLIVHVRDIAHEDSDAQQDDVMKVLHELGIGEDGAVFQALNKIDLLNEDARASWIDRADHDERCAAVSAMSGEGIDRLLSKIDAKLIDQRSFVDCSVELSDGATIAWLYRTAEIVARKDDERSAHFRVRLNPADAGRLQRRLRADGPAESRS